MNTYKSDDGNAEIEILAETAQDAAQEYVDGGSWGEGEETVWVTVYVQQVREAAKEDLTLIHIGDGDERRWAIMQGDTTLGDGDDTPEEIDWTLALQDAVPIEIGERERIKIALKPDEPSCIDSRGDDHDWQEPIELVGGCKENPGVFGHGGGVTITTVCIYCGTERTEDTWAQDRTDGEQGLRSVRYEEGKYADDVKPEYRYEVMESLNAGHALINVDVYVFGERVAGAMFDVDSDGEIECDTESDGCESNPFDDDGWPAPDQSLVDEAVEAAKATDGAFA
jgi:hypothetical protein